jgi:hypothetical protein
MLKKLFVLVTEAKDTYAFLSMASLSIDGKAKSLFKREAPKRP